MKCEIETPLIPKTKENEARAVCECALAVLRDREADDE